MQSDLGLVRYGVVAHDDGSDRMEPVARGQWVRADEAAAAIERLVAERDEALAQAEWWKKCDWWEGGQHDYHRSRATRLEAGLLKLRPGDGTDTERLAAIEQETGLSFTPKLTTHLEPHPAEAQRDKLKEAAGTYFERYCQDEADDVENCVAGEQQHRDAIALRDALAALGDT